jgi:hypothetical protein
VHDVGGEAGRADRGGRQADAVDRDRVALDELAGELGGERQADAVGGRVDDVDGAEARNKTGEDGATTPAGGR